jgi:alpha-ketoglutarate-dependent taurine dioxygenase
MEAQNDHFIPIVRTTIPNLDLCTWAAENREWIKVRMCRYGGLLFRGFNLRSAAEFERFIQSSSTTLLEYHERSSPRSRVCGSIYTSTEYPADQEIFLHNENSYQLTWPLNLYFFCQTPATTGGETPLADTRKIFQRIDPNVRARFAAKKILYVRNFNPGLGLSWQEAFQTSERQAVEEYCRYADIRFEWVQRDGLRVSHVRPAMACHPESGEPVWFNHAIFFHISTLDPAIREPLLSQCREEDLPNNTYYGDGSPIEASVLDQLRMAYREEERVFKWQANDLLALDNTLVSHGRRSYTGPRKILAGFSNLWNWNHLKHPINKC